MKKLLLLLSLLGLFGRVSAQQTVQDTLYYNASWGLTSPQNAHYYRITTIKNGKFDGPFVDVYMPNSSEISTGSYADGQLSGHYIERDTNATVIIDGYFENGERQGIWSFFYNSGMPKIQIDYTGNVAKVVDFFDKHNEQTLANGSGKIVVDFWVKDAEYTLTGSYKNGLRQGKWYFFRKVDNVKLFSETYTKGRFEGGENLLERTPTTTPIFSLNAIFYSERLLETDRYTLAHDTEYTQIPKIGSFFSYLDKSFDLIDHRNLNGFPDDGITNVATDPSGNLWFATKKKGLFCLKNGRIISYPVNSNSGLTFNAIHVDDDGEIWAPFKDKKGYLQSGLLRIRNDSMFVLNAANSGLTFNYISDVNSKNDSIIIGANNCVNVFNKKTNEWTILPNPLIYNNKYDTVQVKNMYQYDLFRYDKAYNYARTILVYGNEIWIGTFRGLDIYRDNAVISLNEENHAAIGNNWIASLASYNDAVLIAFDGRATDGGISLFTNGRWNNMNTENSFLPRNSVKKAVGCRDGKIWILSLPNILMLLDKNRLLIYSDDYVDFKNAINDICVDENGKVFVATNKGIFLQKQKQ